MIAIVGAGPAGLALAYWLQRRNLPYRIFERAEIGHAWNNHYDRLHLHTLKQVSALPGLAMPANYPDFPSGKQFRAYLDQYARHFRLQIDTGVNIVAARATPEGWVIRSNRGIDHARILVAASGIWSKPYLPPLPGLDAFAGSVIHSAAYRNADPYPGQRVLVVGVGNSGSEIAVDLSIRGVETGIAVRSGAAFVPYPTSAVQMELLAWLFRTLPRQAGEWLLRRVRRDFSHVGLALPPGMLIDAYPVVGYQLPQALAASRIRRYAAVVQVQGKEVHFADGQVQPFDAIILATGYRPALDFVATELDFDAQGQPRLDSAGRSLRQERLYCIGYDYPTTEGWLQAIGRSTHRAAAAIAADYAALPPVQPAQRALAQSQ